MDTQRDFERFKTLVTRLCSTMSQFCNDELIESWWKALKHVDYGVVEANVDRFLGRADEGTRFPRPSQMRPKDLAPPDPTLGARNPVRDYWRSMIVHSVAAGLQIPIESFEAFLVANSHSLGPAMRDLMDELCEQEMRGGRTDGMHSGCMRRCGEIVRHFGIGRAA